MGKVADLVDEHRTSRAARLRPTINPWSEHEVVEDKLCASLEQIEEAYLAGRGIENIVFVNSYHWQPPAFGSQRVTRARGRLFLDEDVVKRLLPIGLRHDFRNPDLVLVLCLHNRLSFSLGGEIVLPTDRRSARPQKDREIYSSFHA